MILVPQKGLALTCFKHLFIMTYNVVSTTKSPDTRLSIGFTHTAPIPNLVRDFLFIDILSNQTFSHDTSIVCFPSLAIKFLIEGHISKPGMEWHAYE